MGEHAFTKEERRILIDTLNAGHFRQAIELTRAFGKTVSEGLEEAIVWSKESPRVYPNAGIIKQHPQVVWAMEQLGQRGWIRSGLVSYIELTTDYAQRRPRSIGPYSWTFHLNRKFKRVRLELTSALEAYWSHEGVPVDMYGWLKAFTKKGALLVSRAKPATVLLPLLLNERKWMDRFRVEPPPATNFVLFGSED